MSKEQPRARHGLQDGLQSAERRKTIQGLGALALTANALPILGCSDDEGTNSGAAPITQEDPMAAAGSSAQSGSMASASAGTPTAGPVTPASGQAGTPSAPGMDSAPPSPAPAGMAGGEATPEPTTDMAPEDVAMMDDAAVPDPTMAPPSAPMFDEVAACTLTPTDAAGEGPFFIHNAEIMDDIELFRQDLRDGHEGVELQLNLRMLDTSTDCIEPMAGVEVYVWHTDALGFYSGFNDQNPDMPYAGAFERTPENNDRFCRGAQITNADGVVSFTTLFPGWYNGRPIHIHFLALKPGSGPGTMSYRGEEYAVFTTQMYFEADFSRMILEGNAPYNTRASGAGYEASLIPGSQVRPTVDMEGDIVVASLNILTDSNESRISAGFGTFGRP